MRDKLDELELKYGTNALRNASTLRNDGVSLADCFAMIPNHEERYATPYRAEEYSSAGGHVEGYRICYDSLTTQGIDIKVP